MKVITEDESGGKLMLEEMNRLYFYGVMKIDSFKGIPYLYRYIKDNEDDWKQLKQQAENKLYKELGYVDNKRLMHHITFEKICKLIFANAFKHELFIDNDFRECWNKDCCIKNKRNCNIVGDINLQADIKKCYLLQYSIYGLMADMISGILGIENEIVAIDMVKIEKQCFFNTYHQ